MLWKSCFNKFLDGLLDFFFPKHCAVCDNLMLYCVRVAVCEKCKEKEKTPRYIKEDKFAFDEAVCALPYADGAKATMLKYKFKSIKYYGKAYAYLMMESVKDRPYFKDALVCPVPLSAGRERHYNQTAVIAEEIARTWGCEYCEDLLYKSREIKPLSKMKLSERRFQIEGAISLSPQYSIYGRNILLIDDIFTSGTTANECARILKMYGARKVYVMCACYD